MEVNLNKPPNPRAFPSDTSHGMTLRDYFAAKAIDAVGYNKTLPYKDRIEDVAKKCYEIADAMLKERMKDENDNQF